MPPLYIMGVNIDWTYSSIKTNFSDQILQLEFN